MVPAKRILIIQLRQLGDILLTTPCARELRRLWPECHLTFLTHRMGRLVLDGNPDIDRCIYYHEGDGWLAQLKLLAELRKFRFDLVVDFMNNPRSALFTLATGARERVAFSSARSWAYSTVVPNEWRGEYIVREKFGLLRAIGCDAQDQHLVLPWIKSDLGPTVKFLEQNPHVKRAALRVVLSPTHRREIRQWPLERYAELADLLTERLQASVTWIWGPGEEAVIDNVMRHCRQQTYKAPPTSFRELAALIANHDLFVGNSNGPSHVAVATGICSVQLHGHTNARSWCPESRMHIGIQSPWQTSQPDTAMQAITVDEVFGAVEMLLPNLQSGSSERVVIENWQRPSTIGNRGTEQN